MCSKQISQLKFLIMKNNLTFVSATLIAFIIICATQPVHAQDWKLAGNNLTGAEKLGSLNNFPVTMVTNNIQRIQIDASGHVTVGLNTGPSQFLQFGTSAWMKFPRDQYIWRHSNAQEGMFSSYTFRREEIRDSVAVPTMWFEWTTTGRSYFKGNMGIGANPNTARLFVKRTNIGELARFDGGNQVFNTIYENGLYRGYWGSFAGNAEDVDFGTGIGNSTGKIHFTIQGAPKATIDASGRMGIGTIAPANLLQVGAVQGSRLGIGTTETLEDLGTNTFGSNSSIVPTVDNSRSLGNSKHRWLDVWAVDGTINTSDIRDKKNIRDLDYGLNKIMQLHPVKFNWKNGINTNDKIGIIAQEIQKVLPEVVVDYDIKIDEATGMQQKVPSAKLGVMYAAIIPVLIKSIQELEMQVAELKKQIESKTTNASAVSDAGKVASKTSINAMLEQNMPNPFRQTTTIGYTLPPKFNKAQIVVTDKNGKMFKQVNISGNGKGNLHIDAATLSSGMYNYSLIIDGRVMSSKQMTVTQ